MDVPGGNRLDVLPVLSVIADAWQKHKAKKIFDSPEYRQHLGMLTGTQQQTGTGESQPNPGEMSPYLQKAALNPHVNNAINEAIKARLSALGGDLTQTQTAGMKQQQGFAQGDVNKLGMTPTALEAQSRNKLTEDAVKTGEQNRLYQNLSAGEFQDAGLGFTPETATALNQQEQNRNQKEMIGATKAHGEGANMVEFLKVLGGNMGLMDITKQGSNFGDLMQMLAGSAGPLGEMGKALLNVQKGREADKKKRFDALTSGITSEKPASITPGMVQNPFENDSAQKAYGDMWKNSQPSSVPLNLTAHGLPPSMPSMPFYPPPVKAPRFENQEQLTRQVSDSVQQINKLLAVQGTVDRSSSQGIQKFNTGIGKIVSLAQPLMKVIGQYENMGLQAPPDLMALMQKLTELGINPRAAASEAGAAPIKK